MTDLEAMLLTEIVTLSASLIELAKVAFATSATAWSGETCESASMYAVASNVKLLELLICLSSTLEAKERC